MTPKQIAIINVACNHVRQAACTLERLPAEVLDDEELNTISRARSRLLNTCDELALMVSDALLRQCKCKRRRQRVA